MGTPKGDNGTPKVNGRNGNGTFAKGNKGGPGRKKAGRHELVHKLLDEMVTEDQVRKIIRTWLANAAAGQPWAVKELLDRCIGKADQKISADIQFTLAEAVRTIAENRFARVG